MRTFRFSIPLIALTISSSAASAVRGQSSAEGEPAKQSVDDSLASPEFEKHEVAAQAKETPIKGAGKRAAETPKTIDQLERENEQLRQKIKALDEQLNQKLNSLKEDLDQKIQRVDKNQVHKTEAGAATSKEAPSIFKIRDWLTNVSLMNDLRMRYDGIYAPDPDFVTRHRLRPRLRLGGIVTLKDDFEIGFRLASAPSVGRDSGGDPLSTNQTFEDNGSRKPIGIDWAFARWTPIHTPEWTGSFVLGKLENPPNYTEDVFDVDYTPEGLAEQFSYELNAYNTVSAYLGQYFLDELQSSTKDPFLFLEQLHLDSKWGKHVNTAFTLSGLSIANSKSLTTTAVPDSKHGNTRDAN